MELCEEIVFLKYWIGGSLLFVSILTGAQNIPVGTWRTHFSYTHAKILERTSDKIFCATENGLFSISLPDGSIRKLSKIDGLSDAGVSAMKYDPAIGVLVIGYRSGLIDFIFDDRVESVVEIANSNLEGSKQINDVAFSGVATLIATNLGIVLFNTSETEIRENFVQIGENGIKVQISEIELLGDVVFAKSEVGIQRGNLSDNLLDFTNWTHFPATSNLKSLTVVGNEIYALNGSDLYQFISTTWSDTGIDLPTESINIFSLEEKLLAASGQSIFEFSGTNFEPATSIEAIRVNDIELVDGAYWLADETLGLITEHGESVSPSGPMSDKYSRIKVVNNIMYGFHAPSAASYDGSEKMTGYSKFEDGVWTVEDISNFQNVSDVSRFQTHLFFGSIGDGIYDQARDVILKDIPQSNPEPDTIITSLEAKENLWVSSFSAKNPIHVFDNENWTSFTLGEVLGNEFLDFSVSEAGVLWARGSDQSITVFNPEENRTQHIFTAKELLGVTHNLKISVEDIEISVEDNAWIATSSGPATYADASFVFDNSQVILPSFENRKLFENENINSIETDGGNRVWFGTDRGLWLFEENISELISLFNFSSSPIPSDQILDMTYNGVNGELFVLTDKGLVSFRSASSIGTRGHKNVTIFPNPVRPGYQGLVGVEGLARNASVKITDIHGNLVQQFQSNGGSIAWNLRNISNTEVVTGIYLIFSSTPDGEETYVGKIAVVR